MADEITYKNIQVTGWLRIRMSSIWQLLNSDVFYNSSPNLRQELNHLLLHQNRTSMLRFSD
jgi:hypothetical protein